MQGWLERRNSRSHRWARNNLLSDLDGCPFLLLTKGLQIETHVIVQSRVEGESRGSRGSSRSRGMDAVQVRRGGSSMGCGGTSGLFLRNIRRNVQRLKLMFSSGAVTFFCFRRMNQGIKGQKKMNTIVKKRIETFKKTVYCNFVRSHLPAPCDGQSCPPKTDTAT